MFNNFDERRGNEPTVAFQTPYGGEKATVSYRENVFVPLCSRQLNNLVHLYLLAPWLLFATTDPFLNHSQLKLATCKRVKPLWLN